MSNFGQHATPPSDIVRARRLFACALFIWVIAFLAVRCYVLAHGGTPLRWDAGWYVDVALRGYYFDGDITRQQNVAFLPAYPYALRLFVALGLQASTAVLLMCISCSIAGAILLFRALSTLTSPMVSASACVLFVASPFSLYFLNGYSESLYFLCMSAFWWALFTRRGDGLTTLFAGLAGLVRPFGILLALVWAINVAQRERHAGTPWRHIFARIAALGPLAISGPLALCLYDDYRFGDLFLYRNILVAWGADVVAGGWLDVINHLRVEWRSLAEFHPSLALVSPPDLARLLLWMSLAIIIIAARRVPKGVTIYGIGIFAFCLLTTEGGANLGRHLATNLAFPLGVVSMLLPLLPSMRPRGADLWRYGAIVVIGIVALILQMYLSLKYFQGSWVS